MIDHRVTGLAMAMGLIAAGVAGPAWAVSDVRIAELTLEELLNVRVSVASRTAETTREAAGIVTVISADEIAASGARDLIDVLRLVPGLDLGVDVQGVVGIGVRGNWGHEGKVLLLWDGQELNELNYSTLQLGNHYPLDAIERIEIIRGPGSAIYGGFAELAVINVVTRSAADLGGVRASASWGQASGAAIRRTLSLSLGQTFGKTGIVLHAFGGDGVRSERPYRDIAGASYDLARESSLDPLFLDLGVTHAGFTARVLYDRYRTRERDALDESFPHAVDTDFSSLHVDLSQVIRLSGKLTLTPRLNLKRMTPWRADDPVTVPFQLYWNAPVERVTGGAVLAWQPSSRTDVLFGAERYSERTEFADDVPADYGVFFNGRRSVTFDNTALLAQASFRLGWANLIAGARWEDHSQSGSSFVPRFGITRTAGRTHFKLLYSEAFRAPVAMNFKLNPELDPEETRVWEAETGVRVGEKLFLTANLFDVRISSPIVYFVDETSGFEGYSNFPRTGTRGLELEARVKDRWGWASLAYSTYRAQDNRVDLYAVPGDDRRLLGWPSHKVTLAGRLGLGRGLAIGPSLVYLSERRAVTGASESGELQVGRLDSTLLAHLNLVAEDVLTPGLSLSLGVFDLLDERYAFAQPYLGGHAPLPGPGREVVLRATYQLALPR